MQLVVGEDIIDRQIAHAVVEVINVAALILFINSALKIKATTFLRFVVVAPFSVAFPMLQAARSEYR